MDVPNKDLKIHFFDGQTINIPLVSQSLESLFASSDFITLHVPAQDEYVISAKDFELMKDGVGIVNCARGGAIDEVALIEALDNDKVAFAGLDVFESEPNPEITILMNPKISLTPHIGAATAEAQDRIGTELAHQIIHLLK
jgi:D-3-phosphoglycerate dehydrogenase